MADIVIINPRFELSFWGMEYSLSLLGKRANLPVASLPLLAALTPQKHNVRLIDENVEPIPFDEVAKADIVGVTGMSCQRFRMREILEELKQRRVFTVVGGPLITVQEDYLDGLADVIFVGEAEETWPRFLRQWERGSHETRYEQVRQTDMSTVPAPRLDLLKMKNYAFGSMQISRGCPYQCEFCDIIVTFGRRPRLKTSAQVITELEAFLQQNMESIFVVDDNFIGNKKAMKPILCEIIKWQQAGGYPLTLFTEASLDLAEDDELMQLMGQANFQNVFIGIETPNEESLRETKKYQNVRKQAGTIIDRIHRVQQRGFDVWCGMILGFDHDDTTIFDVQREFLKQARITQAMIGLLHAIPKTPLHARLQTEGRLDFSDDLEFGTNVVPLQMTREELRDGYVKVMNEVYDADAYFDRLDDLFVKQRFKFALHGLPYWRQHPLAWLRRCAINLVRFTGVYWRLMQHVPEDHLRRIYRDRIWRLVRTRPFEPHILLHYAIRVAMHYHYHTLVQGITSLGRTALINSY